MINKPLPELTDDEVQNLITKYKTELSENVSFLFVTYNRCPNKDFGKNPLTWAFQTLINSSWNHINEYVVVMDGCTDFTEANLNWLKSEYSLNIKVIKRDNRKGCSFSRKEGIEHLTNDIFFMGDDDCLYKKDFILGGLVTFKQLQKSLGHKLAILSLPVFEMDTDFRKTESIKFIGKTAFDKAWFYHNFDNYPSEYSTLKNSERYLDNTNTILKPFEIETFKGVTLNSKQAIIDAGNFLDLSIWENDYSEHIEVSNKLVAKGYRMYHLPDAQIACTHIKYGSFRDKLLGGIRDIQFQGVKFTLGKINDFSNIASEDTGCRVSNRKFMEVKIGSFLSFYLKENIEHAKFFVEMEYNNFVKENKNFSTDPELKDLDYNERRQLWSDAVNKGIRVTEQQTNQDFSEFADWLKHYFNS